MDMQTKIAIEEERMTAYLSGEIDHHSAKGIREEIDEALLRSKAKLLVLDFSGVTFMDSSGIGLVMGRYRVVSEFGGEVELKNVTGYIRKVMRLSGIDKIAKMDNGGKK